LVFTVCINTSILYNFVQIKYNIFNLVKLQNLYSQETVFAKAKNIGRNKDIIFLVAITNIMIIPYLV